jgi:hypothetical protein
MLNRKEAKRLIKEFLADKTNKPVKTGIKTPLSKSATNNVYRIPIKFLVPNIYNDRIAGRIREFEELNKRELSFDNIEDIDVIYDFIDKEHPKENKTTFEDLKYNGQREHGIITNDGIVIDGNRRLMLLRKILSLKVSELKNLNINKEEFEYFDAIVYLEDLDKKGIIEKETKIQIAREGPITYNRINLYIKIDNMTKLNMSFDDIATFMGHGYKKNDIKIMHETFELMSEYLISIQKKNQFTLIDGLEDQFLNSKNAFKKIKSAKSANKWYANQPNFLTEFKTITFQLLRAKVEGKNFRKNFLGTNDKSGVLVSEDSWKTFKNEHINAINSKRPISEADWAILAPTFTDNIKRIVTTAGDEIGKITVYMTVSNIASKVKVLKELLNSKAILTKDSRLKLSNIEISIRKILESNGDKD